jgi:crotonobetainyl-CoA:carnitine CoA-transferase CaiB-like acyl-CoA transferase
MPLRGTLVVDLSRYLPGPFATRELLRLGARVVRLEAPAGDPLRDVAPEWDARLNGGKESVVCDLKADPELGRALVARADVVVESFRPGVTTRLGVGPEDVPPSTVYCSITGFGDGDPRVGHDLNYLGWAGALAPTAPAMPPLPFADLGAGGLTAVVRILSALLERTSSGRGARIVVSMTHEAHELAHFAGPLTGALPTYRIYPTADGRHLTVGALEPHFQARLRELLGLEELEALDAVFQTRPLAEWLALFEGEDVAVGPVWTLAEGAVFTREPAEAPPPALGEHTAAWRRELGLPGQRSRS